MLEALSISHGKASAYLPVIDLLRNYFDISVADDGRVIRLAATARQSSDGSSIARCLFSAGIQQVLLRDTNQVAEYADEILSILYQHESLLGLLGATFLRGWAMAAAGEAVRVLPKCAEACRIQWLPRDWSRR